MTILKADVTQVNLGNFSIDGLMDDQGNYYIAVPQISSVFSFDSNQASRSIKALLGKGFTFDKLKTPLNSKPVNAIPVQMFEKMLLEMAIKGNQKAIELSRGLIGLSLQQLFSDAFGVKFEAEDRQRWLATRFNTRHDFRPLTDQLQKHGFNHPSEYAKFICLMQSRIGIKSGERDLASYEILSKLERAQTRLTAYMECGIKPYDALNKI